MRMAGLLEVCADSVCSAVNAARGGADRIELCSALPLGGLSPDEDLFCMVRERVDIPVRVLLRPRAGDFLYDEDEFELLCCQAARFAGLGADGIVIGMLNPDGTLDAERMSALMTCGDGCGVTLHRAFDVCRDAHEALRTAKELGVDTILTSGQQARCADGAPLLRELVSESGGGLRILIGGGVNADVIRALAPQTGADAFHLSAKAAVPSGMEFRREAVPMGAAGMNEFETVLMGRGLGFGCRPGGEVCQAKVEKRFSMHSDQLSSRFQQLVTSIPLPHFMMSERIINHAKLSLGRELSDSIYVTLPDHISGAISRYREGIRLQNPLLWDIQQFYRDEYQVGLKANEIVLEETGVAFTEDEAGFIAMHFVNAQIGGEIREVYDMTYLMQAALRIVREVYGAEPDSSTIEYYRFITHLKFFARRIVGSQKYGDEDTDLLEVVRFKYPRAFACAEKICSYVLTEKGFHAGDNELLYLTIHIARVMKDN